MLTQLRLGPPEIPPSAW